MLHPTLLWNPWGLRMKPFSNVVYAGLVCVEVLSGAGGLLGLVVVWKLCRAVAVCGAERLGGGSFGLSLCVVLWDPFKSSAVTE